MSSTGALSFVYQAIFKTNTTGNILYYINWVLIFSPILLRLTFTSKIPKSYLLPILLVVWSVISSLWSADTGKSLLAALSLLLNVLVSLSIAQNVTLEKFIVLLRKSFVTLLAFSILMLVVANESMFSLLGFSSIFQHKNHSGFFYAMSSLIFLYESSKTSKYKKKSYMILFLMSSCLCVYSNSMLGLIVYVLGIMYFFSTYFFKLSMKGTFWLFIVAFLIMFFVFSPAIAVMLGKDPTFSGRTEIWGVGIRMYYETPFIGVGYKGFFVNTVDSPMHAFNDEFKYYFAPTFHNGFLERLIDTGLVGFLVCLTILVKIVNSLPKCRESFGTISLLYTIFFMGVIENFGESVLFNYNHFLTIVFMVLFFKGTCISAKRKFERTHPNRSPSLDL